jgi:AGZA family xanthine/uracil permease-like MFS transporter
LDLQDILSIIGALFDAIASGLVALYYGFAAFPSGLAFVVGVIGALAFGLVTPISFQAETLVLVGGLGKNIKERLSIVILAGIMMGILGAFGFLGAVLDFIGEDILSGMLAGVGIILARAGLTLMKEHYPSGIVSMIVALSVFFFHGDLAYMIAASILAGTAVYVFMTKGRTNAGLQDLDPVLTARKLNFTKPIFNNWGVWRAALAVCTLQIGANISYGTITGQIANHPVDIDKLTVVSALADFVSALFGGAPMESIIAVTATGTHPVTAGIIFMAIMAVILLSGLLPKLARWIPISSTSGYLFVLGAVLVVPDNMAAAVGGNPLVGSITAVVTAISDPFIGMLAGIIVRMITG